MSFVHPFSLLATPLLVGFSLLVGCGSHASDRTNADAPSADECSAYSAELRACFAKIGAPASATERLATNTVVPRDDAARAQMNASCARQRAELRASCK